MRKGNLTRKEAIEKVGLEVVEKVEYIDFDYTNRVQTDGDEAIEFASSVRFMDQDGYNRTLTAYYYQYQEDLDRAGDDWGRIDWEIEGYEID